MSDNGHRDEGQTRPREFDFMYQPQQAIRVTQQVVEHRRQQGLVLTMPFPTAKGVINPFPANTVSFIQGRPGMGKTKFGISMAMHWAFEAQKFGKENVIVFATWEPNTEELVSLFTYPWTKRTVGDVLGGRVDWNDIAEDVGQFGKMPILIFGNASSRMKGDKKRFGPIAHSNTVRPTIHDLDMALERWSEKYNIAAIVIDYLQNAAWASYPNAMRDQTAAVMWTAERFKMLAEKYDTVVLGMAQSRREVDSYSFELRYKLPDVGDVQWASLVEQGADRMFSITSPIRHIFSQKRMTVDLGMRPGSDQRYRFEYDVQSNRYLIEMNKQRYGFPQYRTVLDLLPDSHAIAEVEGMQPSTTGNNSDYDNEDYMM